jgi:putative tricarboxylic transport membrane protein
LTIKKEPVYVALFFGLIGFFLKRHDFPLSPMLVAIILGPMLEMNMANALTIGDGSFTVFFTTPIGTTFIALSILIITATIVKRMRKEKT